MTSSIVDDLFAALPAPPAAVPDTGPVLAFTLPRPTMQRLLDRAIAVIPARDAMPVLKYARFTATEDRLTVIATDMELTLVASTDQVHVSQPGTAVLPVRKLLDIIRSSGRQDVSIVVDSTGGARISVGTTTWTLRLPSGADFPDPPTLGEAVTVELDALAFTNALHAVQYAAASINIRPALAAVHLHGSHDASGGIGGTVTACDGSRFAQAPLPNFPLTVTLPVSAVDRISVLAGWHDTITFADLDRYVAVGMANEHDSDLFIITKLATAYPDLSATLLRPALTNRDDVLIDSAQLSAALRRVQHTADKDTQGIALTLASTGCTVTSRDPHGNTTVDRFDITWTRPERTVTVHLRHLAELVNTLNDLTFDGTALSMWLGEDTRTRRSPILFRPIMHDLPTGIVAVIPQMYLDWAEEL